MSLFTDKKALSEMISYVLLIIVALALSAIVYNYLVSLTPKEKAECPSDIALYIKEVDCNSTTDTINITYSNTGLFNTSGIYVRLGNIGSLVRKTLNKNSAYLTPSSPGEDITQRVSYSDLNNGSFTLEIQPLVKVKKEFALCEKVIVTKDIVCLD
ncbi:MAG: hypothetical protein AABX11_05270 [Nanoarchaeota archaeon]